MKSLSFLALGASLVGACLVSACASNLGKTESCCSSRGSAPAPAGLASPAAAPEGAAKSEGLSSELRASAGKVLERVTDSVQEEGVRETKPVIGDDSELRK